MCIRDSPYASRTRRGQLEARSSKNRDEGDLKLCERTLLRQRFLDGFARWIGEKSSKSEPKWTPNSSQNRSKIVKNRSSNHLGRSEELGGGFGCPPCASWARLGAILAPSWRPSRPQNGAQIDQKSMQKWIDFLMPLEIGFLMDFGRFGELKLSQIGTKIGSKIDINFEEPFFGARFLRIRGSKMGSKIDEKSIRK